MPLGYASRYTANHKRNLSPSVPQATLVRKAFVLVAEDCDTVEAIHRQLVSVGLKCSISNFRRLLRNPVYCGKIVIPAFEHEEAHQIRGLHEPLVDEGLFDHVQQVLDHRKPLTQINRSKDEELFLRGFFHCPSCGRLLTGSASRGKCGKQYYYYHCRSSCGSE